jgi:hypothetical protein
MLSLASLIDLLERVQAPRWTWSMGHMGKGMYLQAQLRSDPEVRGRKWYVSPYSTVTEVVQTAFKAVMTAEEHELREGFTFDGVNLYHPHHDVEALKAFTLANKPDSRQAEKLVSCE